MTRECKTMRRTLALVENNTQDPNVQVSQGWQISGQVPAAHIKLRWDNKLLLRQRTWTRANG